MARETVDGPGRCGRSEETRGARTGARSHALRGLDWHCFGSAMPPAAAWIAASGWRPDHDDGYCGRCGVSLLPFEDLRRGCGACRRGPGVVDGVVRLGRYARPLSQWVPAIKSRAWRSMGVECGRLLGEAVSRAVYDARLEAPELVVPMPVHWLRRSLRGIDHAGTIAAEVARVLAVPMRPALRIPLRWRQSGAPRRERLGNGSRLALRPSARLEGMRVLLVDDVLTTGATMREAGKLLQAHGARSVTAVVCAVADPPTRQVRSNVDKFCTGGRERRSEEGPAGEMTG